MERTFLLAASPPPGGPFALVPRPEAPGLSSAGRFGDPHAEAEALRERIGLLDVSDAGLVVVEGGEATAFLHRLLANHVRGLAPGSANESLLLTPRGGVRSAFTLLASGPGRFELRAPPGAAADLAAALEGYRFAEALEIRDETERCAPLALAGPGLAGLAPALLQPGPGAPEPGSWTDLCVAQIPARAWRAPAGTSGPPALWVDAGPARVSELWRALLAAGAAPVGLEAREVLRLAAGVPLFGADIDAETYPQEAGLEHAFALDKGCYVGQEVVAKIDTYGGLKRFLALWRLADLRPIARGTPVTDPDGGELGVVTSWVAPLPRDSVGPGGTGSALALGYVKLRALRGEPRWRIGGAEAELVSPPLPAHDAPG